ncbi:MAG: dephospho-CoA kinase [Candidatus Dormibacterales bacterium]
MRQIGLTGGVGSGKSTVAAVLRGLGAFVVDADEAARAVVEPGTEGLRRVAAEFGPRFLAGAGLDRRALAALVFSDPGARARLEAIVHPLVREWMADRLQEAAAGGARLAVLEVPLLYETGLDAGLEGVIVVHVPPDLQVRRLIAGQAYTEAEARARVAAQMPIDQKARRARWLVDNSGSRARTRARVRRLWEEIAAGA